MASRLTTNVVAGLLAFALVSLMIVRTSQAVFTATTENTANAFDAGAIALTDDDSATALFSVSNLAPGDSSTKCIDVTYTGDFTGGDLTNVWMYSTGAFTDSDALSDHLDLNVDTGSGGDAACSGFVQTTADIFDDTLSVFETATDFTTNSVDTSWNPSSSPESLQFRITVTLGTDTPDTAQGDSLSDVGFVWEIQTT